MQVEVDVKCMQTNFDGRGLSDFGDIAHIISDNTSLSVCTIVHVFGFMSHTINNYASSL